MVAYQVIVRYGALLQIRIIQYNSRNNLTNNRVMDG
jgi:hypothetical protein